MALGAASAMLPLIVAAAACCGPAGKGGGPRAGSARIYAPLSRPPREAPCGWESPCRDAAISPAGARVAVTRQSEALSVVEVGAPTEGKVADDVAGPSGACWSPDGSRLLFAKGASRRLACWCCVTDGCGDWGIRQRGARPR